MKQKKKKKEKYLELVTCECGYNNQPYNIERYGTCTRCGKVLNKKAKFDYEMFCKLRMWRGHKDGERVTSKNKEEK